MGSRMIHLAIASQILKHYKIDRARFYLGSLLPDSHLNSAEKMISHYKIPGSKFGDLDFLNPNAFYNDYLNDMNDPLYLGYYVHLYTDEIWLKKIYVPKMVDHQNNIITEKNGDYYKDYEHMNPIIIKKYNLENVVRFNNISIKEINKKAIKRVKNGLKDDFKSKFIEYEYKVLEPNDMIDFIESTSDDLIDLLSQIIKGDKHEISRRL